MIDLFHPVRRICPVTQKTQIAERKEDRTEL
jgi:hypothetical protein